MEFSIPYFELKLTQGMVALVDEADRELVEQYKWRVGKKKGEKTSYARTTFSTDNGACFKTLHRLLMNPPDDMVIDHINGNGLDNRRKNLRICTASQNTMNRDGHGKTSVFKGVSYSKGRVNPWVSVINKGGKYYNVGCFSSEIEAAYWYDKKAKILHGEFARLNSDSKHWDKSIDTSKFTKKVTLNKFIGVNFRKDRKAPRPWRASMTHNGVRMLLGAYATRLEAALAYDDSSHELRGNTDRLNFPERYRHAPVD